MCFFKYVGKEDVVNFINHVEKRMEMESESLVAVHTHTHTCIFNRK